MAGTTGTAAPVFPIAAALVGPHPSRDRRLPFLLLRDPRRLAPADARAGGRLGKNTRLAVAIISLAAEFSGAVCPALPGDRHRRDHPDRRWVFPQAARHLPGLCCGQSAFFSRLGEPRSLAAPHQHAVPDLPHHGAALSSLALAL